MGQEAPSRDEWAEDVDGGIRLGMRNGSPWLALEVGCGDPTAIVTFRAQALERRARRLRIWLLARAVERGELRHAPLAETPENQINRLAQFIMDEAPGEPRQSEGAVDTAIRLLRERLGVK